MIYGIFGLLGAVAGGVYLYGQGDFLLGGLIGLMLAAVINQRNRILAIERRLNRLESKIAGEAESSTKSDQRRASHESASMRVPAAEKKGTSDGGKGADPFGEPIDRPPSSAAEPRSTLDLPALELELADASVGDATVDSSTGRQIAHQQRPSERDTMENPVRRWLLGDNVVVRVGVVVLLFGFAFLVKYAASRNLVPLEVRLAAAFAAGIGLLLLGWRLKDSRFAYAITLQGGGIGVMYLTLFAAARLFHLVPLPLVLGLMIGLVTFSGILAVLQNAAAMAVIGAAGGFMAPVLLSTGSGSHVMLFSYYGLLNVGVFGIAWFRAWRWLNLVGFVFTFGIGSVWGVQYYRPAYFASTEPFLILFFLFYLSIAVLFALRQPPHLKGYVDGTLVFGMPLVVFSLQAGVVKGMPYGLAFSAVALGLIYTGGASLLWRRCEQGLRTLVEAFLALGVIFGSLAIPLALSGSWTAVTWSLEGAGLVWIGLRQRRWTARAFGLLLQIGSGALFLIGNHPIGTQMVFVNSRFLGGMMMGMAGLFCAFILERHPKRLHAVERPLAALAMAWGLVWWLATGLSEIDRAFGRRHEWMGVSSFIGISALAMGVCYRRLNWKAIRFPAMGLLPFMILVCAVLGNGYDVRHPFQGWWSVVWPALFAVHVYLLRVMDAAWPMNLSVFWHSAGALLATVLLSWETGWLLDGVAGGAQVWRFVGWGGVPSVILWVTRRYGGRIKWPSDAWNTACQSWLPLLLTTGLAVWTLFGIFQSGNPRPLPYLPLFNPLDLVQAFVFLVVVDYIVEFGRETVGPPMRLAPSWLWGAVALGMLIWLTGVVARTVHAFALVPYDWEAMIRSDIFHAAISVLWGLLALGGMLAANRLRRRVIWFSGAGLLVVVVIKLFVVDLSGSGSISRIVSFLAVGMLMLVIGFFTPLPPAVLKGSRS